METCLVSLTASNEKEWACSREDPRTLPPKDTTWADCELIRILTKAVEELGLEWSAPEEPACSHLDK